jgi:hypothetical protein
MLIRFAIAALASAVDAVAGDQMSRLDAYVESGKPVVAR